MTSALQAGSFFGDTASARFAGAAPQELAIRPGKPTRFRGLFVSIEFVGKCNARFSEGAVFGVDEDRTAADILAGGSFGYGDPITRPIGFSGGPR